MPIYLRKNIGWITIMILASLPVIRWFFISPLNSRFFDLNSAMTSFGQVAGLLGMSLFSINLILSARSKYLDRFFYGLNNLYSIHRAIGAIGFSLLLFHPLLLVIKYVRFSLKEAALFLLPGSNPAITYGIIALGLMIALIAVTFYSKIKYQNWKISHKFMVLVFIFAILHVFFTSSDVSRDMILRAYVLSLGVVGLAAGFYQTFLSKFINRDSVYEVRAVTMLNPQVASIILKSEGEPIIFTPGQFVFVRFENARPGSEKHPFSITSAPNDPDMRLVIKSLGDFTGGLKDLRVGSRAAVEGPYGKFSGENIPNKNQVWVAGGVGITPFLSMAKCLTPETGRVDLYYCTRDRTEAVLLSDLDNISALNHNFKIISWYSDERGRISGEKIAEMSGGLSGKDILLCGPVPFMDALRKQFIGLKVARRHIHWEKFNLI